MSKRGDWVDIVCEFCGDPARKRWNNKTKPRFCGKGCSARWRSTTPEGKAHHRKCGSAGKGRKLPPRPDARARMLRDNPMFDASIREKMVKTLREIGHRPPVQGGNGRGMTDCEKQVSMRTGLLPLAVTVPKEIRGSVRPRPPNHYKIDLACGEEMLAVEIDGLSHGALKRQEQDRRKEKILSSLGWRVLRFSNQEVEEDLEKVVASIRSCMTSK